jgi:hypothetical protein
MGFIKLNLSETRHVSRTRYGRNLFLSFTFKFYALALLIICLVSLTFGYWLCYKLFLYGYFIYLPILAIAVTTFDWAKRSWILAKRYSAIDAEMALAKDDRAPILFLRSFLDQFTGNDRWIYVESDEELIYPVVKHLGPVIAIGQPGEFLPPLSASRLYINADSDWHSVVKEYMARSQLVIISPSDTEGVIWEISTAFKLSRPKKVLLSLIDFQPSYSTYKGDDAYGRYRKAICRKLSISLPENIGDAIFLAFDKDWYPILLRSGRFITRFSKRLTIWDVIQRHLRSQGIGLTGVFPLKESFLTYCRITLLLLLFISPFLLMFLGATSRK